MTDFDTAKMKKAMGDLEKFTELWKVVVAAQEAMKFFDSAQSEILSKRKQVERLEREWLAVSEQLDDIKREVETARAVAKNEMASLEADVAAQREAFAIESARSVEHNAAARAERRQGMEVEEAAFRSVLADIRREIAGAKEELKETRVAVQRKKSPPSVLNEVAA